MGMLLRVPCGRLWRLVADLKRVLRDGSLVWRIGIELGSRAKQLACRTPAAGSGNPVK